MVSDKPFRLRVLEALTAALETTVLTGQDGATLEDSVFRGRIEFGEDDPLPMVSILETPVPIDPLPSPEGSGDSFTEWDLLIQGFVKDDPKNPTDPAHYLMADVKKTLAAERMRRDGNDTNILQMGGLVDQLTISSGSVRPSDDISAVAYFWLRITLKIVEDNYNPYC